MTSNESFKNSLRGYVGELQRECVLKDKEYSKAKIEARAEEQFYLEKNSNFVEKLEKVIGQVKNKKILEIGSGSGWRSVSMALAGADVCGVEPVPQGVQASKYRSERYQSLTYKPDFKQGIAEKLPFGDKSFDVVVSFQVIEHVKNIDTAFEEMYRVLKDGGVVYLETGNSLWPREEHYRIFWMPYTPKFLGKIYARLRGKNPEHLDNVHFTYKYSMMRRMKRAGFKDVVDEFEKYFLQKIRSSESINNKHVRRLFLASQKIGLGNVLGAVLVKIGLYPSLYLLGKK